MFKFGDLNEEELAALSSLQSSLPTPTFLALPPGTARMTVDSDACSKLISGVVLQEQPAGTGHLN